MKLLLILSAFLFTQSASSQKIVTVSFTNDYNDIYHLSLIVYTPDGKIQTRVSNVNPTELKTYDLPVGTEIFIADYKQEAYAMKGNDIKATGIKPTLVIGENNENVSVLLSSLSKEKNQPNLSTRER